MIISGVCLVTGARAWTDEDHVRLVVSRLPSETLVIHGMARGLDTMFGKAALMRGLPVLEVQADWSKSQQGAGHTRNQHMVNLASAFRIAGKVVWCYAFLHGESRGTRDCIRRIKKAELHLTVFEQTTGLVIPISAGRKR